MVGFVLTYQPGSSSKLVVLTLFPASPKLPEAEGTHAIPEVPVSTCRSVVKGLSGLQLDKTEDFRFYP